MKFVVTGGRGFIGSHFVEKLLQENHSVIDFDCMTYCSSKQLPFDNNPNYTLVQQNICDITHLPPCDVVVNFAAETHVDNSINDSIPFIKSNILGVHNLLQVIKGKHPYERPLFVHISTDEVYGDKLDGKFVETDRLYPSNPYAASKAAAEMLVLSYHRTYGIQYLMTRSSNNYGDRQYIEKLIPKSLRCIDENKKIPLHGDGSYVRDWIYVKDNVDGIYHLIMSGKTNDVYNIGANNYLKNIDVVIELLKLKNKNTSLIQYVENRWGQDLKYSVNTDKINNLGWYPKYNNGIYTGWIK
jgi:dTDP-glucose 4,6-dehydratase